VLQNVLQNGCHASHAPPEMSQGTRSSRPQVSTIGCIDAVGHITMPNNKTS